MHTDKSIKITYQKKEYNLQYVKSHIKSNSVYESHFHPNFEFILLLKGKINGVINEKIYKLDKEGVLIIPPYCYHNVSSFPETEYERITLLFSKDLIPADIQKEFICFINKSPMIVNARCQEISRNLAKMFTSSYQNYANLAILLIQELFYSVLLETNSYTYYNGDEKIRLIIEYIDLHIKEKIYLEDITKYVFLSISSICHLFKKKMNITVKQYILQKKIAYASSLIESGVSARDAAYEVGYENYANFYKIYKSIMNCSPHSQSRIYYINEK